MKSKSFNNRIYNLAHAIKNNINCFILDKVGDHRVHRYDDLNLPMRPFGNTGLAIPVLSLGGQGIIETRFSAKTADMVLNHALDLGIKYIDTAPTYGASQSYIGRFISHRRKDYMLGSKCRGRSYDQVLRTLDKVLSELKTDSLDIYFIHSISTPEDFENLFSGRQAGIKAFIKAKEEKIIRFVGSSCDTDPSHINKAIHEGVLDVVMIPVNPADVHGGSFIRETIPLAREKGLAIFGMQIFAGNRLLKKVRSLVPKDAIHYALSQDIDSVLIGVDNIMQLETNTLLAWQFNSLDRGTMEKIENLASSRHSQINRFKSYESSCLRKETSNGIELS